MTNLVDRSRIMALQQTMMAFPEELKRTPEVIHTFAPGMYARTMFIPDDTCIIGKIHKHAHINMVSEGTCRVSTEFDSYTIQAPFQFVSEPGTKRVVHALTDVVWTTYHANPTDTQDLKELERQIIAESYECLEWERTS